MMHGKLWSGCAYKKKEWVGTALPSMSARNSGRKIHFGKDTYGSCVSFSGPARRLDD
jgi:hypothetical protein